MPHAIPTTIIESHFGETLEYKSLPFFRLVSADGWIRFARSYRDSMERSFSEEFLGPRPDQPDSLRLVFEPSLRDEWDRAVKHRGPPTPLLGVSPYPISGEMASRDGVSQMLGPLKKHLLFAKSVYIPDSFYRCFDHMADSVDPRVWRDDPNVRASVERGVQAIRDWLPILIELRPLLDSEALVFMPYYVTPSFPYRGTGPNLKAYLEQIRLRPHESRNLPAVGKFDIGSWEEPPVLPSHGVDVEASHDAHFDKDDVVGAWLNARLLDLSPVFPTREMFDWAANLYFDDGKAADMMSDLVSVDVLPFGKETGLDLEALLRIRQNEKVFSEVARATVACKEYLRTNLGESSTRLGVTAACRTFLQDYLAAYERGSFLRFVDEKPAAGVAFSVAVGATLLTANPIVGVIAGAVLNPQLARKVQKRLDPTLRAVARLQALL